MRPGDRHPSLLRQLPQTPAGGVPVHPGTAGTVAVDRVTVSCGHRGIACRHAWTGSWTGAPDYPSAASAFSAITCAIRATRTLGAQSRTSCKRQASGSNPLTGSQGVIRHALEALAADSLIIVRHGRATVVAGEPSGDPRLSRRRPGPGHDCLLAGCRPHVCHPMKASTIRGIHSILSGAFGAAQRWEWTDRNPTMTAKPPTTIRRPIPATSPDDVAKVIAEARARNAALGLYLWSVVVTGVRRGELCGLQIGDIDLDRGLVHVAFNYVVRGGQRVRKDTKTHQDRWLAIDPDTCALIATYLDETAAALATVGVELRDDAYLFSNDPAHSRPWNPDWGTHQIAAAADAAGVKLDIKGGRHYTASQLLAGGFDLRNTAARLGHSGGGATTLRHYADPVPEVDRRAAAYLAKLTAGSTSQD
jgi:integrase